MIEEIMLRLAYELDTEMNDLRPADHFDSMGGVGFGGLCALFLGRLRMTVDQGMEELSTLAAATFPKGSSEINSPEANTYCLRDSIEGILERFNHPTNLKLHDTSGSRCKVVVFAATKTHMNHCQPFRTYRSTHRSIDSTFVEAACAILAVPDIFASISIGRRSIKQLFAGIPYGFNNPTKEVLKEARLVFGDEMHVSLVLSLGSRQQPLLPNADSHKTLLARIVSDCDPITHDLSHQFSGAGEYLRLNVDRGLKSISISDWDDLGSILSSTDVYLQMMPIITYIDEASQWLLKRARSVTLGQLIGSRKSNLRVHSQELTQHSGIKYFRRSPSISEGVNEPVPASLVAAEVDGTSQTDYSLYVGSRKSPLPSPNARLVEPFPSPRISDGTPSLDMLIAAFSQPNNVRYPPPTPLAVIEEGPIEKATMSRSPLWLFVLGRKERMIGGGRAQRTILPMLRRDDAKHAGTSVRLLRVGKMSVRRRMRIFPCSVQTPSECGMSRFLSNSSILRITIPPLSCSVPVAYFSSTLWLTAKPSFNPHHPVGVIDT